MVTSVHLGYSIPDGQAVAIPLAHTCVTGQSQQAGKTTALEGLIARSGVRAVTFITKRGEGSFQDGRRLAPFFRERADWVFVASLIDATLGEKNKLLRSWLMKVCRNTTTLAEVQANVREARKTARGFNESIYTEIDGYLELVVPQLAQLPPATRVELGPGVNVMDLSPYSSELQGLVIRSVLEHVYERERDVVTVIPEAWEFLPEQRGSPVKLAAETLIRKGAALRNFMWIDSQDLAGVWKLAVRACPVVLIGVQREANEIKRTLANIPAGLAKPSAADIATLEIGQFFACWGRHATKTYVQPVWLSNPDAQMTATGAKPRLQPPATRGWDGYYVDDDTGRVHKFQGAEETTVTKTEADRLTKENDDLKRANHDMRRQVGELESRLKALEGDRHDPTGATADRVGPDRKQPADFGRATAARAATAPQGARTFTAQESLDNEALYQAFKTRLIEELPSDTRVMRIVTARPELVVEVEPKIVTLDGSNTRGRVARLIAQGWLDEPRAVAGVRQELKRTGADPGGGGTLYDSMNAFVRDGFLVRVGDQFAKAPGLKVTERELVAR